MLHRGEGFSWGSNEFSKREWHCGQREWHKYRLEPWACMEGLGMVSSRVPEQQDLAGVLGDVTEISSGIKEP